MNISRFDVGCVVGTVIALTCCIACSKETGWVGWGMIVLAGGALMSIGSHIAERLPE